METRDDSAEPCCELRQARFKVYTHRLRIQALEKELEEERRRNNDCLREVLENLRSIISESKGVVGWHLNGDIAEWDEFGYPERIDEVLERANNAREDASAN
jgi:hypothetical protein